VDAIVKKWHMAGAGEWARLTQFQFSMSSTFSDQRLSKIVHDILQLVPYGDKTKLFADEHVARWR
jgi:hypothetical protein